MNRTSLWPLTAVSTAVVILGVVGCNAQKATPTGGHKAPTTENPKPGGSKLFANWPKPQGALIVTGEQVGYLEPCGCTKGQLGGLGRRYDLVGRLRDQGWSLALVDLGSFADSPGGRGGPQESQVKFTIALRAFSALKYDAIALSADDLKQGIAETLGHYLNLNDQPKPKIVAANVTPAQGFEGAIRPSLRTSAGPVAIGITAVIDPEAYKALNDQSADLLTVSPPESALPGILADLEKDTKVQVLMVQGPPDKARDLARAFPGFEIVVATSEVADPDADPIMLNDGKTMLVQVGKKGKYVGVVGLFDDPKQPLRYQRVNLNSNYKQAEPMRKLIDDEYQSELKALNVVADYPKHAYVGGAGGATYVGADACKTCHANTYAKWASTKHAIAYDDVKKAKHEFDAECISCHTTGFEYLGGFRSAELTPHLKGNQCENCHGPGSKHSAEPDNPEYRKLLTQAVANADQNRLCLRCHDDDNSPDFKFEKYYGQIVHKAMDRYDDPKVHQGLKLEPAGQAAAAR